MKITLAEQKFILRHRASAKLLTLAAFASIPEFDENEVTAINFKAMVPGLKKVMKKMGLHVSSGDGLIQILFKSGRHVAKLVWLMLKYATTKDPEVKTKLKDKMKNTKVKPAQMLDVLLKIDTITLHALTGPIHALDAIMGWHIGADLKHAAQDASHQAKEAFRYLKKLGKKVGKDSQKDFRIYLNKLSTLVFKKAVPKGV